MQFISFKIPTHMIQCLKITYKPTYMECHRNNILTSTVYMYIYYMAKYHTGYEQSARFLIPHHKILLQQLYYTV